MANKTVYLSTGQEQRVKVLGVTMAQVIAAGLDALEGSSPLLVLSPDLQEAVTKTTHLLDMVTRGKVAVLPDRQQDRQTATEKSV